MEHKNVQKFITDPFMVESSHLVLALHASDPSSNPAGREILDCTFDVGVHSKLVRTIEYLLVCETHLVSHKITYKFHIGNVVMTQLCLNWWMCQLHLYCGTTLQNAAV